MNVQADLVFEQYFAPSIRNDPAQMRIAVMGLLQSDLFIHKTLALEKVRFLTVIKVSSSLTMVTFSVVTVGRRVSKTGIGKRPRFWRPAHA